MILSPAEESAAERKELAVEACIEGLRAEWWDNHILAVYLAQGRWLSSVQKVDPCEMRQESRPCQDAKEALAAGLLLVEDAMYADALKWIESEYPERHWYKP
jgi:hypothetical protein